MKITDVRAHHIRIPYDAGVASFRQGASAITALDMVMVEVIDRRRPDRLGRCLRLCLPAHHAHRVEEMIAPQARGLEVPDAAGIPAVMEQIQRNLHLFGRYGITMFAISGLDIALWDLAAQGRRACRCIACSATRSARKFRPMRACCGSARPTRSQANARRRCGCGYGAIKLHETTTPAVFAAREAIGPGIPLMVDMNCPLDGRARSHLRRPAADAEPMFLEEPVWPPEDFATLAEVRAKGGLDIAAGENACTVYQFRQMMNAGAVSHAQPSVIKVGGITEFLKVAALADGSASRSFRTRPISGPACWRHCSCWRCATTAFVEVFYMKREACLWRGRVDVDANGHVEVPEGPGLGYEPDREVMERYRVA